MSLRTTFSYLLWPLTIWYGVGVCIRNFLYDIGLKKRISPHITTIGIGNLCVGGTGKTPLTEHLLALFSPLYRTAMLSGGYHRKSKGYQQDDGSHNPLILGDEAAMVAAHHPEVTVAVCKNRCEGIQRLMELPDEQKPQLVVLDDVFQHRKIEPNINILLTEYSRPYFADHILPFGNLREFRGGHYRAGVVIVTKCPANFNPIDRHNIEQALKLKNYQRVYFSYLSYGRPLTLEGEETDIDLSLIDRTLIVTGIAHPKPLVDEVQKYSKVRHLSFPDHHDYTANDINHIREVFNTMPGSNKIVLTTSKDAVKLQRFDCGFPIYVQPISVAFHGDVESDFDQFITASVKENISFLDKLQIWN